MNKLKTSELTDAALDWAVAKAEGMEIDGPTVITREFYWDDDGLQWVVEWEPTTNWTQGGPIIERERISVISDFHEIEEGWLAESYQDNIQQFGPTPLIAAMRCYVMSRLGDEIEIPQELF